MFNLLPKYMTAQCYWSYRPTTHIDDNSHLSRKTVKMPTGNLGSALKVNKL